MRITEAAQRLDTSPRMLRYRDLLGLLPPVREPAPARHHTGGRQPTHGTGLSRQTAPGDAPRPAPAHRRFGEEDLAAVSLALGIEQRYDISPAALAFGLRVLTEPGVRADVAELARRIGRIGPLPARALEFEKERALRLLSLAPGRRPERPARPDGQRTKAASRPAR
jgi:MerR family transcriptional regulator, copper efflux regulator